MIDMAGIIEAEVRSFGVRLYDWRMAGDTLQVFIDADTGVTIELCAEVTRGLARYFRDRTIEVSSPGIERQLSRPDHFMRVLGKRVQVNTVQGSRTGVLVSVADDALELRIGEESGERIPFSDITNAFLKVSTEELFRRSNG